MAVRSMNKPCRYACRAAFYINAWLQEAISHPAMQSDCLYPAMADIYSAMIMGMDDQPAAIA